MNTLKQEETLVEHVQWIFPRLKVHGRMGHDVKGRAIVAIEFGISIYHDSMETLNHCGLEINHIKSIDDNLIVCVIDRRTDRA